MSENPEPSVKEKMVSCLTQQISEYEILKSMYPNPEEIILTDMDTLDHIHTFLEGQSDYTPSHLDFTVNLFVSGLKLEVCINLPSFYPEEEPDIFIRCNQLNRQQETSLNTELSNFIKSNHLGEVCVYTALSWVQENIDTFNKTMVNKSTEQETSKNNLEEEKFVRLWIYSHHIFNKKKREEIIKQAKDLSLTGFSLPGKPGIICIEGPESDCNLWWREIKSMAWKKIEIRKKEEFNPSEKNVHQKFMKFEEILTRDSKHFAKLMEHNGLSQVFNEFFGLCKDL